MNICMFSLWHVYLQGNTALHVAYIKANEPVKEILLKASKDKGLNLEAVKNKVGIEELH